MTSTLKKAFTAVALFASLALCAFAQGPLSLPAPAVYARAYGAWNIFGQQANTYTFNGGACNYTPLNGAPASSFFVFSGTEASSTVYFPVAIYDANPALNEIVTPSSTVATTSTCGFSGSTANQHTSFTLGSGTAGLQEAVTSVVTAGVPYPVILDPYWYTAVSGLPGRPTPESIIKATTGATAVQIIDTTSSPYTYWRWTGSAYAAVALTGGSAAPTAAAGAAAGTSPTGPTNTGDGNTFSVALTAGTATTTGTLFTETWAAPTTGFAFPPVCTVWSSGANAFTTFTTAVTFPSGHALLTVTASAAPIASTAYAFKVVCQ